MATSWDRVNANMIPLGKARTFDGYGEDNDFPPPPPPSEFVPPPPPPPEEDNFIPPPPPEEDDNPRGRMVIRERKKRRSRWGVRNTHTALAKDYQTFISRDLSPRMREEYVTQLRILEIGHKLRYGPVVPPDKERSPSPEPTYGPDGKRNNTREDRYQEKLERERHKLVETALAKNPNFTPPYDYKRPSKITDRIWIPARDFPHINFIGLLIGPRGQTLKKMETESGAKISIRGKGSIKEGKGRPQDGKADGADEDLHCMITADSDEKIKKAKNAINKIIEMSATTPEGQNELKRKQLRMLAELNGTLRNDEEQGCVHCGSTDHRRFECPEKNNFTNTLTCRICGNAGHLSRDCKQRDVSESVKRDDKLLDQEYYQLLLETNEPVNPNALGSEGVALWQKTQGNNANATVPPWQQQTPWAAAAAQANPWQQAGYDPATAQAQMDPNSYAAYYNDPAYAQYFSDPAYAAYFQQMYQQQYQGDASQWNAYQTGAIPQPENPSS